MFMKRTLFVVLTCAVLIASCGKDNITDLSDGSGSSSSTTDLDGGYAATTFDRTVQIVYSSDGVTVTGTDDSQQTVSKSGAGVTIINTGSEKVRYELSGSSSNGYLKIYSGRKQALLLDGLSLTNSNGAAINIQGPQASLSSGKCAYVVVSGENSLADGSTYSTTPTDEDEKAAFFSEGQLIFSGSGSLTVNATGKAGITSDDYVKITEDLTISIVSSAGNGMRGKDSVIVAGGTIDINVSANGAKGISTDGPCLIAGGATTITTTGNTVIVDADTNKVSCLKADGNFTITAGTLQVTASGTGAKGISVDGAGYFKGGTVKATATGSNFGTSSSGGRGPWGGGGGSQSSGGVKAKAIKCEGDITVSGCNITASSSNHEAFETKGQLTVTDGVLYCTSAGDDAINSAGDMSLEGGYVYGYTSGTQTGSDGIDANGDLYVRGGVVYAICMTGNADRALDANTEGGKTLYIKGGTLIAVGGMESGASLSQTCYQAASYAKNTTYALTVGSTVYAFTTPSGGSSLIVSGSETPTLKSGVSVSGGTEYFGGMLVTGATVDGGTSVSLNQYSGGSGGGHGGWGGH